MSSDSVIYVFRECFTYLSERAERFRTLHRYQINYMIAVYNSTLSPAAAQDPVPQHPAPYPPVP
jgi:hypothetical protein